MTIELSSHESIADIGREAWDSLLRPDTPPFLHFDWLDALERTGCVRPERGWLPMHLSLRQHGRLIAAAPAYVKGNSEGEFVFDHAWARFCESNLGKDYYPKLIVAVPFTPATGPRVLFADGTDPELVYGAFASGLAGVTERLGVSGAHVLFPNDEQADGLERAGLLRRAGVQFHWQNPGYTSFDDFLARFSSKRRNQIKRELRELERQGVELTTLTGSDIDRRAVDEMYEFYLATVNKYFWGRRYLNRGFFHEVTSRMADRLHFVFARRAGRTIAGAFNLLGTDSLYGRYWGAAEDVPCLHFNVCYYRGIQDAIERKLKVFEPGAGGEHKLARGFEPTVTHSLHVLPDRRLREPIADFLRREREAVLEHVAEQRAEGVLKPAPACDPPA